MDFKQLKGRRVEVKGNKGTVDEVISMYGITIVAIALDGNEETGVLISNTSYEDFRKSHGKDFKLFNVKKKKVKASCTCNNLRGEIQKLEDELTKAKKQDSAKLAIITALKDNLVEIVDDINELEG